MSALKDPRNREVLTVNLSKAEKQRITRAAEKEARSVSAFVRLAALKAADATLGERT